jgi:hypothetical protein
VVALSLAVQSQHFVESKIIRESDHAEYGRAIHETSLLQSSVVAEILIGLLALLTSIMSRLGSRIHERTSWEHDGASVTIAGWWYALISLPILLYFLFRWGYVFLLWSCYLFRVSRLNLDLTPTHPDHAGGLGFLAWGLVSFAPVLTAVSAVISAGFAYEIIHRNESLQSLKYHAITFVVVILLLLHAPLLTFSHRLSNCRYHGLLAYSRFVLRHDRRFDEKWIENPAPDDDELLGSVDIQSLADIGTVYRHVYEMRLIPFDGKAFAVLVAAAVLPLVPLLGTVIPLNEIFAKLLELMA